MAGKKQKNPKTVPVSSPKSIGYARVSTETQSFQLQEDAFAAMGVLPEDIYHDVLSGLTVRRTGLSRALRALRAGDTFIVWKLDRLGRDMAFLIRFIKKLTDNGIYFRSITECIVTDIHNMSAIVKLQVNMLAAFAQFEVDMTSERARAGAQSAKRRGVHVGAKEKVTDKQVRAAVKMRLSGKSMAVVAKKFAVSDQTIRRRANVLGLSLTKPNKRK